MGGVLLNEARRVLVPATHDEEMNCLSARAVVPGRWWAHLVGAHWIHIDKHWPDFLEQSDRGPDERARHRGKQLPDVETADHGRGGEAVGSVERLTEESGQV